MEEFYKTSLHFKNKELESEVNSIYNENTRIQMKSGLIFSLVMWAMGIVLIYFYLPNYFSKLSTVIFLVTFPYFIFLIYISYKNKLQKHYQWMIASTNALAGLLNIYIFSHTEHADVYALVFLIFVVFFGHSYKIKFYYITIASFIYLLAYQIFLINLEGLSKTDFVLYSFLIWGLQCFFVMIEYRKDLTERQLFIQQKTILKQKEEIEEERKKSENLLLNILPVSIVKRLKNGETVIADSYDNISVLFTDLVGFTQLSSKMSAENLVKLLNDIFSKFDLLVEEFGLEKIKTIGDAYMVVGGAPEPDNNHLEKMANLALKMTDVLNIMNDNYKHDLKIRIGIHEGNALAGVIGSKKFIYDVWGDTVNIASRMESHGVPGKVHVSAEVYEELKSIFNFQNRGLIEIKGKGKMETYILEGKK